MEQFSIFGTVGETVGGAVGKNTKLFNNVDALGNFKITELPIELKAFKQDELMPANKINNIADPKAAANIGAGVKPADDAANIGAGAKPVDDAANMADAKTLNNGGDDAAKTFKDGDALKNGGDAKTFKDGDGDDAAKTLKDGGGDTLKDGDDAAALKKPKNEKAKLLEPSDNPKLPEKTEGALKQDKKVLDFMKKNGVTLAAAAVGVYGIYVLSAASKGYNENNNKQLQIVRMVDADSKDVPYVSDVPVASTYYDSTYYSLENQNSVVIITFTPDAEIIEGDRIQINDDTDMIPKHSEDIFDIIEIISSNQIKINIQNVQKYATKGSLTLKTTLENWLKKENKDAGKDIGGDTGGEIFGKTGDFILDSINGTFDGIKKGFSLGDDLFSGLSDTATSVLSGLKWVCIFCVCIIIMYGLSFLIGKLKKSSE